MKKGPLTQLWEQLHAFFSDYDPVDAPRVIHADVVSYIKRSLKKNREDKAMACLRNYFAECVEDTGEDPVELHQQISDQLKANTRIYSPFAQKVAKADPTTWLPKPKSE